MHTATPPQPPDHDTARAARAAARRAWPVQRHRLGEEPGEDLSATTTAAERMAMVWQLTLDAWALTGRPWPDYPRTAAPGRVIRPAGTAQIKQRPSDGDDG
jgi:hypothetical protein